VRDLTVLVSVTCAACAQALALVRDLADARPGHQVVVRDVDAPGFRAPPGFAGTPMFYRGDTVLFYGNPTPEELLAAVDGGLP